MIRSILLLTAFVALAIRVDAEVTRVDITTRSDVGNSGYEKIVGTVHFAVDPKDPRNRVIVDLSCGRRTPGDRAASRSSRC
jgi:hypothetical protein